MCKMQSSVISVCIGYGLYYDRRVQKSDKISRSGYRKLILCGYLDAGFNEEEIKPIGLASS